MKNLLVISSFLTIFILCGCKPSKSNVSSEENAISSIETVGDLLSHCSVLQKDVFVTHKRYSTITAFMIDPVHECYSGLIKKLFTVGFKEISPSKEYGYTVAVVDDSSTSTDSSQQIIAVYTIETSRNGYRTRKYWSYDELSTLKIPEKIGSILGFFDIKLDVNPSGEAYFNNYMREK